jgi:aldehyde dehydrogenase family protein/enoyl-ACP reductase-like protein
MTANLQQTISPVDGSIYAERQLATSREIENALAKAVRSQAAWKRIPVSERAAECKRMLDWLLERADEIGEELTWQIGRPIAYSPNEIRRGFQERVNYMAGIAERELADIELEPKENFRRFIRREPVGVVLALAPWNYPWLASVNALCPGPLRTELLMSYVNTEEKKQRRLIHIPMGRVGEAKEIARAALFLASDESSYITGTDFLVDGGITAAYVTPE